MANSSRRILKEFSDLTKSPLEGITVAADQQNIYNWTATITGPAGSLYEKGIYHLNITILTEYPFKAPIVSFSPIIYHPAVDQKDGIACIDILNSGWAPTCKIAMVLKELREMLANINPAHAASPDIAAEYANDRPNFVKHLNEWIQQNATK